MEDVLDIVILFGALVVLTYAAAAVARELAVKSGLPPEAIKLGVGIASQALAR